LSVDLEFLVEQRHLAIALGVDRSVFDDALIG